MLEKRVLGLKLAKKEYKAQMPELQRRLHLMQRACWKAKLGSLVVFEGWETAGKGDAIRKLTERLEPRGFRHHSFREPRTFETHLPWMWRFWMAVPNYGEMAVFQRSWYAQALEDRVDRQLSDPAWHRACEDIRFFERALADDHHALVKIFLHLDREEREKRLKALEKDPATRWQVTDTLWEQHARYDQYRLAIEEILVRSEAEWGPWEIIDATDRRRMRVRVIETLLRRLEGELSRRGLPLPDYNEPGHEDAEDEEDDPPLPDEDADDNGDDNGGDNGGEDGEDNGGNDGGEDGDNGKAGA